MSDKIKKAVGFFLTAAAAIAEGVLVLIGAAPPWWGTVIALVVAGAGILLGKPWSWPEE